MERYFEQGPIRPPSEAKSLLIRLTRNCPWNKCAFCRTYKNEKFEFREIADIMEDIDALADSAGKIMDLSFKEGEAGVITEKILRNIFYTSPSYNDMHRHVALWLYHGGESIFLQDADSLIMKAEDVAAILKRIKEKFPYVKRITTYCRSKTASRKSVDELKMLNAAGLSRIHIGMESGCDPLLKFIRKGVTAAEHIDGGRKVKAAGISLSEYIIPGLGGNRWSKEHAKETARVINAINPDFVRLRTLHVSKNTFLMELMEKGEFVPLDDDEIVNEIREFVSELRGVESSIVSDHVLNLLEELDGKLPEDKAKLLTVLDRYLSLSERDRKIFKLGRRKGIYRELDDLDRPKTREALLDILQKVERKDNTLEKHLSAIMDNYV